MFVLSLDHFKLPDTEQQIRKGNWQQKKNLHEELEFRSVLGSRPSIVLKRPHVTPVSGVMMD